jgi:hypothetical protein
LRIADDTKIRTRRKKMFGVLSPLTRRSLLAASAAVGTVGLAALAAPSYAQTVLAA